MSAMTALHQTPARASARYAPRTAFVLSGGASLAAVQVGMLHALYERAIAPDVLVGTSAGALNAAFVASRPQRTATTRELARIWRSIEREDVFPVSMTALIGGIRGHRDHLIPDRGLRQLVRRHVEFDDLAAAAISLHVIAFDLNEGCEVRLSSGSAIDAIAGSAAIPGVFPPVVVKDRRLIDGGVVNNTPISHAVELGAERIYVLCTQGPGDKPSGAPATALDAAITGLRLLIDNRLDKDIARYGRDVELIVLPVPSVVGIGPTCFEHSTRLIAEAREAARVHLARRGVGGRLRLVT